MEILGFYIHEKILSVLLIVLGFVLSLKLLNFILRKFYMKHNAIHWRYCGNALRAVLIILFIALLGSQFTITSQISVELFKSTSLIVAVLGFAAQEILRDILSGMMISLAKPYDIGSRITITNLNVTGIVEDITLRHTIIKCFDNSRLVIPNSVINKDVLKSTDYEDSMIGNFLEIPISYESDVRLASAILQSIVVSHPLVLDSLKDPKYEKTCIVLVKDLLDTGIILKTTVWTKDVTDNFKACSDIRIELKEAYEKAGIVIPYFKVIDIADRANIGVLGETSGGNESFTKEE